jgi:hypothetical protein
MMFPSKPIGEEDPPEYGTQIAPVDIPPDLAAIIGDKVLQWRCKVFLDLGLTLEQARTLTLQKDADTNYARRLRGAGCDPHLVFDIIAA